MTRILLRKPTRSFIKGKFWTKTMAMLLFFYALCMSLLAPKKQKVGTKMVVTPYALSDINTPPLL